MTPAGRPDPDAFTAPGGVFVPAAVARQVAYELLPSLAELGRRRLSPVAIAVVQALAVAELGASTPQPVDDAGPWVSTTDAARAVGCTPRYVRHLARTGAVDARRHGARAWSVDLASVHRHFRYRN